MSKKHVSKSSIVINPMTSVKPSIRIKDLDVGTIFGMDKHIYLITKMEYPNEAEDGQCWLMDMNDPQIVCYGLDEVIEEIYDYEIVLKPIGIY